MADDKKKVDKSKSESAPRKSGNDFIWEIVGVFIALILLTTVLSHFSFYSLTSGSDSNNTNGQQSNSIPEGNYNIFSNLFNAANRSNLLSSGNLSVGTEAKNKGLIQVRREPGGSVIGMQDRGEMAKIVDGPITAYGEKWWMVDYDNPPSGWVNEKDITNKFFLYYFFNFFPILWDYIKLIGWALSVFFGIVIIYALIRDVGVPVYDNDPLPGEPSNKFNAPVASIGTASSPINLPTGEYLKEHEENLRWKQVELLMKSHNSSDWRQAIIEADVMLEDMLDKMGYPGVSIGEKLKNVEESDFETLDKAWEAHKVRNRIAHDGINYKLSYEEVARVISLYRDIFNEFYWI